jgi:hypothetical protein
MDIFLPGKYKISSDLTTLKIHNADDELTPVVGNFFKNDTIDVFQVFPVNAKGIVWGMITPPNTPVKKYIGMSVYGKPKVVRFADLPEAESETSRDALASAVNGLTLAINALAAQVHELTNK